MVDGVDFWVDGSPPHRFEILGALTDERWASGLIGAIRMSGLEHDIAKLTREKGGDAVILQDSHNELRGFVGSSFGSAFGNRYSAFGSATTYSTPLESHAARYLVVRYVPDDRVIGAVAEPQVAPAQPQATPHAAAPPPGLPPAQPRTLPGRATRPVRPLPRSPPLRTRRASRAA